MNNINIVSTDKAPAAVGPYSQAIVVNNFVFCSGQIGIDPKTGILTPGVQSQIKQIMINIQVVLKASGSDLNHVIKTTVYLKNMTDYPVFNQLYEEFFKDHKPARSTVQVASLPKGALVEIDAIATL